MSAPNATDCTTKNDEDVNLCYMYFTIINIFKNIRNDRKGLTEFRQYLFNFLEIIVSKA